VASNSKIDPFLLPFQPWIMKYVNNFRGTFAVEYGLCGFVQNGALVVNTVPFWLSIEERHGRVVKVSDS
jgi:hypothetical protein